MSGPTDLEARMYADRAHKLANELQAKEFELDGLRKRVARLEAEKRALVDAIEGLAVTARTVGEA